MVYSALVSDSDVKLLLCCSILYVCRFDLFFLTWGGRLHMLESLG